MVWADDDGRFPRDTNMEPRLARLQPILDRGPRARPPETLERQVVLYGEAGIGMTRLLTATADLARTSGFDLIETAAHELEHSQAFGPLLESLDVPEGPRTSSSRVSGLGGSVLA